MLRPGSPPCGFSTLTTSAPSQANASVQEGPASNWVRSSTRTPARQLRGAALSVIRTNSDQTCRPHDTAPAGAPPMKSNKPSIFIDGEAGSTGVEIRRRLEMVPEVTLRSLPVAQRKDPSARQD